ncbi:MAG: pyridoxal phosphate-dependent aminotransferase [Rubricella sp.]
MRLSNRLTSLPDPDGDAWAVFIRARAMQEAGESVTMLCIGDHDRVTPEPLLDAMAESARGGQTGYAPITGTAALREAIAGRMSRNTASPVTAEQIAVTPGAQFALYAAITAVTDPGDRLVMLDPYYATYPLTLKAASATAVVSPSLPDAGFQPDLDALARNARGARAILINTPNNPTGAVYTSETLAAIAEIARREDLWILSDEVYSGQVWDGEHRSIRALPGMADRTIVISSLSKSHVMTGSRIGWLCAPERLVTPMLEFLIATSYGVPGFIQDMALHAIRNGEEIEAETAATYRHRRDLGLRILTGANRLRVSPPQGAMYLMLDVRGTGLSGTDFAERLLDEERIAVTPCEGFGPSAAGHVRIALTVGDESLSDALTRIRRFAERL